MRRELFPLLSQITNNIFTQDTFQGEKNIVYVRLTISISICLFVYVCVRVNGLCIHLT